MDYEKCIIILFLSNNMEFLFIFLPVDTVSLYDERISHIMNSNNLEGTN